MEAQMINIGNNQQEKIVTKELKINKKVFIYNETVIPLCNISRISVADAPKKPYSLWYFAVVVLGFLLLGTGSGTGVLIGLMLLGGVGFIIYNTYKVNQDVHEYLVLNLNSGQNIFLYSKDHSFTIKVMDVIINCMNLEKEYVVNMENCKIEACQFGNDNIMGRRENGNKF